MEPDTCCSRCGADLHTCTNCRHFDSGAPLECRLDIPVRIAKKSSRNDCESFEIKETLESADASSGGESARSAFDALFDF